MLSTLIFLAGLAHFGVLTAALLVPFRLQWKKELGLLPPLQRKMYWIYGGYIVLAIVAFGLLSVFHAQELAQRTGLARSLCAYMTIFWGIRLSLQGVLDVKQHLTTWWLKLGYHSLTLVFLGFVMIYGYAAI